MQKCDFTRFFKLFDAAFSFSKEILVGWQIKKNEGHKVFSDGKFEAENYVFSVVRLGR